MKKILITNLFLVGFLFILSTQAQENSFSDYNSSLGSPIIQTNEHPIPTLTAAGCEYTLDDGTKENSVGLTSGGDMMWLNSFTSYYGCQTIFQISLAWGNIPNGGPCRVILYDDPNNDGDPSDAVYLSEASTIVVNANTDIFTTVYITPTTVSGGFFVAALYQNQISGEYPASLDESSLSQASSWFAGEIAPGGFDINNLSNNSLPPILSGNAGIDGNVLLRCTGSFSVPISNWALGIGLLLISGFIVIRFRRRLS